MKDNVAASNENKADETCLGSLLLHNLEVYIGVRKFWTSEKLSSPIRTYVGQPIFSWAIFGQAISYINVHAFSILKVYKPVAHAHRAHAYAQ